MPGPIALLSRADGWVVQCRLCSFASGLITDEQEAEDVAHGHVVAAHPEVEEP